MTNKPNITLETIIELTTKIHTLPQRELFISLMINSVLDYLDELEDLTEDDITVLSEVYDRYITSNTINTLINPDIIDLVKVVSEEREENNNVK